MAIGESTIFLLSPQQFEQYAQRPRPAARTPKPKPTNQFLRVGPVESNPDWHDSDKSHAASGGHWTVYVIRLKDGSYYVGQTRKNAQQRFEEHLDGVWGAHVTRERGAAELVYQVECRSRQAALEVELHSFRMLRGCGVRVTMGEDPDG